MEFLMGFSAKLELLTKKMGGKENTIVLDWGNSNPAAPPCSAINAWEELGWLNDMGWR